MKQIEFLSVGRPEDVVRYAEAAMPPEPEGDSVLVKVMAFPINPADLLTMQGVYPRLDVSTSAVGNEAVGEIVAAGTDVEGLAPGDRVILLTLNNWRQFRLVKAHDVIGLSSHGDLMQQAGLKVNPATASLLLQNFVDLKPGDWIIQDAANSAVGRATIQLAKLSGVRTINVVRRADVVDELEKLGADVVLVDGDDLSARAHAEIGDGSIVLGIDSVGGAATDRIAACLGPGGTLVIYGAMSGTPCAINPGTLVFQDIRIRGFWLSKYLMNVPRDAVKALYARLDDLSSSGRLVTKVDSVFRADDIKSAVRRASTPGINGKVMVVFE
jgi:NADPH:quinone reductase-like Zn-dependent oxidoreductase